MIQENNFQIFFNRRARWEDVITLMFKHKFSVDSIMLQDTDTDVLKDEIAPGCLSDNKVHVHGVWYVVR